ncbi:MAG: DUF4007 family protein [Candidatus Poribacteria bacterium]|nr:DUF4007 family protein [Candidatus Poribacteria bacterium]
MKNFLIAENTTSPYLKNPSFSGHQTFPFRYTWLKKGVDAVREKSTVFSLEDASVTLGVGKNMVDSIRYWCGVSGLIKVKSNQLQLDLREKGGTRQHKQFVLTELGKAIFGDQNRKGFDPYLEDPATLWLIHWKIASNINQATSWYWAFNILKKNPFTLSTFKEELSEWTRQQKASMRPVSPNTLHRDVNCFIRTYCQSRYNSNAAVAEETFNCPLVELDLITELPDNNGYAFQRGEKETLPIEIFTATLIAFWDVCFPGRETLPFSDLMYKSLSPGRLFRLDEEAMVIYLENLEQLTNRALEYGESEGLKQVYRRKDLNPMELLKEYYG